MKQKLIPLREQGFHLRALPRAILFAVLLITPIAILFTPEEPGLPHFIRAFSSMLQMAGFGIIIAHRAPLWEQEGVKSDVSPEKQT